MAKPRPGRARTPPPAPRDARKGRPGAAPPAPAPRTVRHPLFGAVPLVERRIPDPAGGPDRVVVDFDPAYAPPLPPGAVRGDIRRQNLCTHCHVPRYFYVDEPKTCAQCGERFIFAAAEQKHWYETLGFYGTSTAIRCVRCRRLRRTAAVLGKQLAAAARALRETPDDPAALLALARATVEHAARTGKGRVAEAVAAARRARRLAPPAQLAAESHYWEGAAQDLAGRRGAARTAYRAFVAAADRSGPLHALAADADRRLI